MVVHFIRCPIVKAPWAQSVKAFNRTTLSNHDWPVAKNVLAQDVTAMGWNQRWVSDVTYIRTQVGWLYLAGMMDLYSRTIVGWAMDKYMGVCKLPCQVGSSKLKFSKFNCVNDRLTPSPQIGPLTA